MSFCRYAPFGEMTETDFSGLKDIFQVSDQFVMKVNSLSNWEFDQEFADFLLKVTGSFMSMY